MPILHMGWGFVKRFLRDSLRQQAVEGALAAEWVINFTDEHEEAHRWDAEGGPSPIDRVRERGRLEMTLSDFSGSR